MGVKALRTHQEWLARTKGLRTGTTKPAAADTIAAYQRVAADVERAIHHGISEWHLEQTWQLLSLEQGRAGDHRSAAATLHHLADHHRALLMAHRRGCVASLAAAAMHLVTAGDVAAARKVLRSAEPLTRGLRPQEYLFKRAKKAVASSR